MVAIGRGALDGDLWGLVFLVLGVPLLLAGIAGVLGQEKWKRKLGAGGSSLATVLLIILIIIGIFIFLKGGTDFLSIHREPEPTIPVAEQIPLSLPIKAVITNEISGAAMTDVSVYLVDNSGRVLEQLALSGNAYVSSMKYRSGESIFLKIVDGSAFYVATVSLPYYEKDVAEITQPDYHEVTIRVPDAPTTLSIKVYDEAGNLISDGSTLNTTSLGKTTFTLTISVINTEQDTSTYPAFNNPATKSTFYSALLLVADKPLAVSGMNPLYTDASKTAMWGDIAGLKAVLDPRTNTVKPGTETFVVTIDASAITSSTTVTIAAYLDFDTSYYKSMGIVNGEAVQLATFSLTITK